MGDIRSGVIDDDKWIISFQIDFDVNFTDPRQRTALKQAAHEIFSLTIRPLPYQSSIYLDVPMTDMKTLVTILETFMKYLDTWGLFIVMPDFPKPLVL
jgi:hypothetical protein